MTRLQLLFGTSEAEPNKILNLQIGSGKDITYKNDNTSNTESGQSYRILTESCRYITRVERIKKKHIYALICIKLVYHKIYDKCKEAEVNSIYPATGLRLPLGGEGC